MNNYHFIIDFETLSNDAANAAIVNCAYGLFDWDRFLTDQPYTFDELIEQEIVFSKLDVENQVKLYGYKINKETIAWWKEQGDAAKQLIKKDDDQTLVTFTSELNNYLKNVKVKYWWSRSNTFDPIILERIMRDTNVHNIFSNRLKFWLVRDTRTWVDAKTAWKMKNNFMPIPKEVSDAVFELHNPVHDVAVDILRLQVLERAENGLEVEI